MSAFYYMADTKNKLLMGLTSNWQHWYEFNYEDDKQFLTDKDCLRLFLQEIVFNKDTPEELPDYFPSLLNAIFEFAKCGVEHIRVFIDNTDDLYYCKCLGYKFVTDWAGIEEEIDNAHLLAENKRRYTLSPEDLERIKNDPELKVYLESD